MKSLSSILLEKLKINKDTDLKIDFNKGDEVCCLSLYFNNEWDKKVELQIRPPFIIKSIDDNEIIYITPFHNRDIKREYYVNSKGILQTDANDSRAGKITGKKRNYDNTIFLPPYKYKDILELLIKEKIFNPKYSEEATNKITNILDKDYFDGVDMKELRSKTLVVYDNTNNGYVNPIERPKELKEIIDKYYAKY